jgi:LAO/AO transport system kinase
MKPTDFEAMVERFLNGDRYALAKVLSHAENRTESLVLFYDRLYSRVGTAQRVGITGPPGAGKSTLIEMLARSLRDSGRTVGVLAVDPTSPFSGGALLGDRVRMQRLTLEEGIFVRSMASRGSVGGLARATDEAADVMDAFGFDILLIETVGVGQSEVDVAGIADTTVVVLFPGAGDVIQAMKAGLMEIADLFAINKADLDGADMVEHEIADSLALRQDDDGGWKPRILKCSAREGEGVDDLIRAMDEHHDLLKSNGLLVRRRGEHIRAKVRRLVNDRLLEHIWTRCRMEERLEALELKGTSPYRLAETMIRELSENLWKDGS